jgi:spore coat polysaccharide biosynthesis protein SpsF
MHQTLRIVATIEVRMTSSRLPGKVLMPAGGKPLLQILLERLRTCKALDEVVVATTVNATDDPIAGLCSSLNVPCFRGSEENVLSRVCGAAQEHAADVLVEITGDCPLLDPWLVDDAVDVFIRKQGKHSYVANFPPRGNASIGQSVQVFRSADLRAIAAAEPDQMEIEHVSYRFYRPENEDRYRPFFINYDAPINRPDVWMALDYLEDYELLKVVHESLSPGNPLYGVREMIACVDAHPELHQRCWKQRGK